MEMNNLNRPRSRCFNRNVKCFGVFVSVSLICLWMYLQPHRLSERELKPCKLQTLDPWDSSLKPYFVTPPPLKCSNREQLMFMNKDGYLLFNNTVLEKYKLANKSLSCVYSPLKRDGGDKRVGFEGEVNFMAPAFIKRHVFRVSCSNATKHLVYDYLHFNPVWNEDARSANQIENESENRLSVIIFGIDSVSRSHALRNLPKSYKFLLDEFDAYDFEGYSKVGENTWPNFVPLLTGQSHKSFPLIQHFGKHIDSMPFVWNEKVVQHFATFLSEDRPEISAFSYGKGGFKHQPTDYYFRPYTLGMHEFEPKVIDFLGKASWDCYGVNNYFDIEIEYLKGFLRRYQSKRKYVLFWNNQVSHEEFTTLSRGDQPFLEFLTWLKNTKQTENAIFIVLSDHGYRIGGASLTHVGRAENNKPWLMVHVPKFLKEKYKWLHGTLTINTKRLVSPYDIYQTMSDLVHGVAFKRQTMRSVEKHIVRRNIFIQIPEDRTCADAGTEGIYCTCQDKLNVSTTAEHVESMAEFLVSEVNKILSQNQDVCFRLSLHIVNEASVSFSNSDEDTQGRIPNVNAQKPGFLSSLFSSTKPDTTGRYFILFHTIPGYAYFEGTVDFLQYGPDGNKNQMTMIGEPSRLDRYGNQSYCVQDINLKPYCYCKNYKKVS
ncbi:uncharacterized protein LOC123523937 [Mercenaria mercenaria]|uniref:uncharacterized protein LOC123523937 n=1 Tax=Mercenaria mercenaria TaxID=6596 RepID=UPI00234E4ADE|nr:uncharacterized protein LOC123523937 [Mercenaria mercenaria]